MKELKRNVEEIIESELAAASAKYGRTYASPHEAYGVIAEEFHEAEDEMDIVNCRMKGIPWGLKRGIKPVEWEKIATAATMGACELIQVAVVAIKAQRGFGNEN